MSTLIASGHVLIGAQVNPALAGMAKVNSAMEATATRGQKMGKAINVAAKGAAIGLGVMAIGAVKSVKAASDLNESINKSSVLFGQFAKTMPGFGSSVAKSLGMSRDAALDNAAGIGAMLIPMGVSQKEAAAMSSRMLTLAADLGSFHNADPTEMLDRLRAGLSGESEPLKRFGIVLTEARVKAEAFRMGIAKQGATLTESQKLQARYSLALRDSGAANGDFARTSDGLANQQRILMAQVNDLAASLGMVLLPAATRIVAAFSSMVTWGQQNQTTLKVIATVAASLGTAILVVAGAMKAAAVATALLNAVMYANPIVLVVAAIAALAVGLVIAYKNSEKFRAIVDGAFKAVAVSAKALVAAFNAVLSWVKGNWKTIAVLITGPFAPLVALATDAFGIRSALIGAFSAMLGAAKSGMTAIVGSVRGTTGAALGAAKAVGKAIIDGVKAGLAAIRSIYTVMWSGISGAISGAAGAALGAAAAIGRAIVSGALSGMGGLASALRSAAQGAVRSALSNLNPFSPVEHGGEIYIGKPIIDGAVKGIKKNQNALTSTLSKAVREAIKTAKSNAGDLSGGLAGMIGQGVDALSGRRSAELYNSPEAQRLRDIETNQRAIASERERARLHEAIRLAETDTDRRQAQSDLDDWILEQERQRLSASLAAKEQAIRDEADARKTAAERGLADLTDSFNKGLLSQEAYLRSVTAILEGSVGNYASLGGLLGSAFVSQFTQQLGNLVAQINQIARMSGGAAIPKVTLPSGPDRPPRRAKMGGIVGGTGLTDKVPLLAAPGEGVLSHRGMDNLMEMAMDGRRGGGGGSSLVVNIYDRTTTGMSREQARRLADQIAPELNRRVSLAS